MSACAKLLVSFEHTGRKGVVVQRLEPFTAVTSMTSEQRRVLNGKTACCWATSPTPSRTNSTSRRRAAVGLGRRLQTNTSGLGLTSPPPAHALPRLPVGLRQEQRNKQQEYAARQRVEG